MLDRQATTPTSSSAAVMLLRQKYGSGLSRFERDNAEAMEAGQRWIAAQRKQIALLRTLKHDDHVGRRIRLAENRLDKEAAKLHEAVWANRDMRRRIDALFDEWQSLNGTAVSLSSDIETKRKEHADGSAYIANAKRTLEIAQRKMVEIEQAADRQTVRFRAGLERLAERLQTYRQRVMASTEIGDDTKCNLLSRADQIGTRLKSCSAGTRRNSTESAEAGEMSATSSSRRSSLSLLDMASFAPSPYADDSSSVATTETARLDMGGPIDMNALLGLDQGVPECKDQEVTVSSLPTMLDGDSASDDSDGVDDEVCTPVSISDLRNPQRRLPVAQSPKVNYSPRPPATDLPSAPSGRRYSRCHTARPA